MKAKVLKQFKDKYTKELYKKGQVIEVTNERYEEINSTAHGILVKVIEEINAEPGQKVNFEDMTKKEIIEYAKSKGVELNTRMTKAEMIKELM